MGMEYIYVQCVGAPDVENLCINQSQLLATVSAYLSINMCIGILKTCVTSLMPAKLVLLFCGWMMMKCSPWSPGGPGGPAGQLQCLDDGR